MDSLRVKKQIKQIRTEIENPLAPYCMDYTVYIRDTWLTHGDRSGYPSKFYFRIITKNDPNCGQIGRSGLK